jgi:hypothetical protein
MSSVARSFFSVELCFSFTHGQRIHDEVRRVLARTGDDVSPATKWANHRAVADVLLAGIDHASRGCWEYMDDDSSDVMWDDWLLPLNDRSRQPRGEEAGGWFTMTMMFQARRRTQTDRVFATAFENVGDQLWRRETFAEMLHTIPAISFANVVRDALYLMPRDTNCGFTDDELASERMKYLRLLHG